MNCNQKENAVSLLHAAPNALRGLHDAFGFDFEQPFTVLHSAIGFTVNKIQKTLRLYGFTSNAFAALLVYDASWPCWRVATLDHGKVKAVFERYEFPRWYELGYKEPFDDFYTKGSFEELRKAWAEVYVVAQERTHLRKQEAKPIDYTARYRVIDGEWDYNRSIRLARMDSKGNKVKYSEPAHRYRETVSISDCIDKSGYLTYDRRENLRRRAQALREERAKAAYLASDKQQEQIEELCGLIAIRQMELVEALTVANTSQEFMAVSKAIGEYSWHSFSGIVSDYETFCEKTRNKSYPSIEDSDRAYNKIKTSLLIELKRIAAA